MTDRFRYRGPAVIDGIHFTVVLLQEDTGPGESLRSWSGTTSFPADATPPGFSGHLGAEGPVKVELPEGRSGQVLVTNVHFDGRAWTVHLQGTGPAPS
jgi:hypothetical protein